MALEAGLRARDNAEYAWAIPIANVSACLTTLGNITLVSGNRISRMQGIRIHIQDRSHGNVLVEFVAQNGSKPSRSWIDHAAHRTMHFNFRGHRSRREPRAELARYVVPARELVLRKCVEDHLYRNAGRSNTVT